MNGYRPPEKMNTQNDKLVRPAKIISGELTVPGDKSISHRSALLSALAEGKSTIRGFLMGEDCLNTINALKAMGTEISITEDVIIISGTQGKLKKPSHVLDLGNSGTSIRLLAGILSAQPFVSEMTGDASLRSRPMRRIKEPLELMGAKVELLGENGCAPIRITGGKLRAIEYRLPVVSAQVKSCVLLAGLFAEGTTSVIEPIPTRDHTERMLKAMGADIQIAGDVISIRGNGGAPLFLKACSWEIPGDFSSSAFWIGAAASRPGAEVTIKNVGLNPRRTAFIDVLREMGADIKVIQEKPAGWEPSGMVVVRGNRLKGIHVGGTIIPNLIDELPLIAMLGAIAEGKTVISDAHELKVKESNRIVTTATNLKTLGVRVITKEDGLVVEGSARIRGGCELDSFGDHRIAMASAILALSADAPVLIRNVSCVATSYPQFWEHMSILCKY
jgi:3-phosphoshikimate 1-carboxyvinyltransferase